MSSAVGKSGRDLRTPLPRWPMAPPLFLRPSVCQVRKEKVDLESHLEMEQEYIVNKLQKQLTEVIRQKNALEMKLNEGHGGLISKLEQSVDQYKESLQPQVFPGVHLTTADQSAGVLPDALPPSPLLSPATPTPSIDVSH